MGVTSGEPSESPLGDSVAQGRPWHAPPDDVVPGGLADHLLLARTDAVAVAAGRLAAYPTGFEFTVWAVGRPGELLGHSDQPLAGRSPKAEGGEPPAEVFRLQIQFSDGAIASNLEGPRYPRVGAKPPLRGPVLSAGASMAGQNRSWQHYWVSPLPPEGPLALVCEWPAKGVPRTRVEIDAALILDAAARAEQLSPEAQN